MKISKTPKSRIDSVDFNNLVFGTNFSDHMLVCVFKDGKWQEPEIKPYGAVPMKYSLHALHYGQSAFEGLKAYKHEGFWKCMDNLGEKIELEKIYKKNKKL